jgi:hypothetical protein
MMSQKLLSNKLSEDINWTSFFTMVKDLGAQLNERQLRFLKARLIESALAKMSNGKLEWVDSIGQDHQYGDTRIETKFMTNGLTSASGEFKKTNRTSEIKLTNTLGSSEGRDLPDTFDYLLIVDTNCAAIVSREKLLPYVKSNGDGLKASVPYDDLDFISRVDLNSLTFKRNIDIMSKVDNMLFEIAESYI